jgi:hypothetical protein
MLGDCLHWPCEHEQELKELLDLAVNRLTAMISPVDGCPPEFMTSWLREEDANAAAASVQEQIDDLMKKRRLLDIT